MSARPDDILVLPADPDAPIPFVVTEKRTEVCLNQLPDAAVALLRAVVEALDIPMPGIDDKDERAHRRLLERRTTDLRIILASMLKFPDLDITKDVETIRARTAAAPVTYTVYVPAEQDGGEA